MKTFPETNRLFIFFYIFLFSAGWQTYAQPNFVSALWEVSSDGVTWENTNRDLSAYNEQGMVSEKYSQSWLPDESNWQTQYEFTNTYNTDGEIVVSLRKLIGDGQPDSYLRRVYTYSATQKLVLELIEKLQDDVWKFSSKTEHQYDSSDKLTGDVIYQWTGFSWVQKNSVAYTYDSNGNQSSKTEMSYDPSYSVDRITTYEYDDQNRRTVLDQDFFSNGDLIKELTHTFYYSGDNTSPDYYIQEGAMLPNPVQVLSKTIFNYDSQERILQTQEDKWIESAWKPFLRASYFYPNLGLNQFKIQTALAFPNPFETAFTISTKNIPFGTRYSILNILGETVNSGSITSENTVIENQIKSAGTYFIKIGSAKETIKVIKK